MNKKLVAYSVELAMLCSLSAANTVFAQAQKGQEAQALEEVIVTARKREESIQKVPVSISVFGGQLFADQGRFTGLDDVIENIVGADLVDSTGNPFNKEAIIRGAGTGRKENADSAVGLYFNGAYVAGGNSGGRTFSRSDYFDMQRFELLRGPQGALYGRNAVGGAMNVISHSPNEDFSGEVELGYGDNDNTSIMGIVNLPATDQLAFRLGMDIENQNEGFFTNSNSDSPTGKYIDTIGYKAFRTSMAYNPSSTFDLNIQIDYSDEKRAGDLVFDRGFDVEEDVRAAFDDFKKDFDGPNEAEQKMANININANWEFDFATLTVVANYRDRESSSDFDFDQSSDAQQVVHQGDDTNRTSIEARLLGELDSGLVWLAGADYTALDNTLTSVRSGFGIPIADFSFEADSNNESYSVFGSLEQDFGGRMTAGIELRYTQDNKKIKAFAVGSDGALIFDSSGPDFDNDWENATGAVHAVYKLTDNANVFARAGTGFRAGGYNSDVRDFTDSSADTVPNPFYDEEHARSAELGIKGNYFGNRLYVSAAAFYTEYNDILVSVNNGGNGRRGERISYLINGGDAEIAGVELEGVLGGSFGQGTYNVRGAATWTDTEITDSDVVTPVSATCRAGNSDFSDLREIELKGRELTRVPEWQVALSGTVRHPITDTLGGFFNARVTRSEKGYSDTVNCAPLVDATIANVNMGVVTDKWTLALKVTNVTDEDKPRHLNSGQNNILVREPRSWKVYFTYFID